MNNYRNKPNDQKEFEAMSWVIKIGVRNDSCCFLLKNKKTGKNPYFKQRRKLNGV